MGTGKFNSGENGNGSNKNVKTLAEYVCSFKNSCSSSVEFVRLSLGQLPVREESESVGH